MLIGDKQTYEKALTLKQKLEKEFANKRWNNITLCSGFLTESAVDEILTLIENAAFNKDIPITFLIGAKQCFTEPDAIKALIDFKRAKPKISVKVRRPKDIGFHLKCYMFRAPRTRRALVGSANLTSAGLACIGELMVEVSDIETIKEITSYIDCFLDNSVDWEECLEEYREAYKKHKPTFTDMDFFKRTPIKPAKIRLPRHIRHPQPPLVLAAPTSDSLANVDDETEERMNTLWGKLKSQGKSINKAHSIILLNTDKDEVLRDYKEGYSIDRAWGVCDDGWVLGKKRAICIIGAVGVTDHDEAVIYMKTGSPIKYKVTQDILVKAEEYDIMSTTPTQENLGKYRDFIVGATKSKS